MKDLNEQHIRGCVYEEEVQIAKNPNIYLIERIMKRRGDLLRVKWLGFDNSHNSWIHKDNVLA